MRIVQELTIQLPFFIRRHRVMNSAKLVAEIYTQEMSSERRALYKMINGRYTWKQNRNHLVCPRKRSCAD